MDTGVPSLEVGFTIDTGGSFDSLAQLERVMGSAEAKVLAEATRIEQATRGMVNLGGATAQITTFGAAATRELEDVRQATGRAEKAGEGMVRSLERQIETFGKTTAEIRNMRAEQRAAAAEAQGLTELADRLRSANAEMIRLEGGQGGVTNGAARMRAAMQGASYQVQDLITQVSMGANPINALAVQGGQLAGQFSNVENKAGAVARFMIGPWGLAITAGLMVLGPLVAKLMESNNELDDAVDKLGKDARQTEITREAKERFATSVDGVRAAILDQKAALDQSVKSLQTQAEQANIAAKQQVEFEIRTRNATKALLDQAMAQAQVDQQRSQGPGQRGELATLAATESQRTVAALQAKVAEQDGLIATAEMNLNRTRVTLAAEVASQTSTQAGRITRSYDQQIAAMKRTADEQARAGKTIDASLTTQIRRLEQQKAAALEAANAQEKLGKATQATAQIGRNISLGDAESIVRGMGGHVTSALRSRDKQQELYDKYQAYKAGTGPWAALAAKPGTSNHELGQAIDIAKADGITLKKLITTFRQKGVSLTEALDEGSHYHIAWKKVGEQAREASAAQGAADRALRLAQSEAAQRVKESTGYLARLEGETAGLGRTADEIKQVEIAAEAAKAPTEALREKILAAGAAWENANWTKDNGSLADTVKIPDLSGIVSKGAMADPARDVLDQLSAIADQAQVTGSALADAFGRPGDAIGSLLANLADYRVQREDITQRMIEQGKNQAQIEGVLGNLQKRNTMQALSGLKTLFKEHSAGYKVMSTIEKAYAAFQAVQTALAIARDISQTTSHLANSATRTTANTAEGGSKMFSQLGIYAFPVVAAMIAVLAALGAKGGGGGASGPSVPSADDLQAKAGTGTVLGDSKAKSESIARSLDLVAANTNSDLQYSNDMLKALRSIDAGIGRMAGAVARQIAVAGGMFDQGRLSLGETGSKGFLGLFGSSTTRSLYDQGINLAATTVGQIIANGIAGNSYQVVEQIKKKSGFLGIGGGTKTSYVTTTGGLDGSITQAVQGVIVSLRNGLVTAAGMIGVDGAQAILDSFEVSIGQISFKDMTGKEIEDQLNAIFSSVGDQMATKLLPSLTSMQLVGEGLFETFVRVAKEYESVDVALQSIGRTFGAVGLDSIQARDELVQLFGGLDDFISSTNFFRDNFLTEAQQIAPVQAAVTAELQRLGAAGIQTRDQFRQAVLGLDLTSDAGRDMYASLLALAPAFDKVIKYQEGLGKSTSDTLKQTVDSFTKLAESLQKYRDGLFATDAAQGDAYAALRARFVSTQALAANGDQTALGNLESVSKAFLDSSLNNASTREQYQRDVALVARGVDQGIFAAKETADYAQLQLDAATNAVTLLGSISASTASTAAALKGPGQTFSQLPIPATTYIEQASTNDVANGGGQGQSYEELVQAVAELRDELAGQRADMNAGLATVAGNTNRVARTLENVTAPTGGDSIAMTNLA